MIKAYILSAVANTLKQSLANANTHSFNEWNTPHIHNYNYLKTMYSE